MTSAEAALDHEKETDVVPLSKTLSEALRRSAWKPETAEKRGAVLEEVQAVKLIEASRAIVLDVDLGCFTSRSDVDPSTILPWPRAVIEEFVMPAGSESFWNSALSKSVARTLAREPKHCGGVVASAPLLRDACEVLFTRLLGVDLP